ncbi:MAG: DUF4251 domain-containing protein [Prolixibacteraceae bacterium]|nr:DUF4251 domain-containing protein [Prolixibacteraceae bacterium]
MKTTFICILIILAATPFYAQNSRKAEKQQQKAGAFLSMKQIIEERNFTFRADHALPISGSSINLTTNPNYLTFSGDSVYCDMPFFGRAYRVDFDFEGGFDFSGVPHEFEIRTKEKKQKIFIKFKIRDDFDSYHCNLTLTSEESATLTINSNNRASISYWGKISENNSPDEMNSK